MQWKVSCSIACNMYAWGVLGLVGSKLCAQHLIWCVGFFREGSPLKKKVKWKRKGFIWCFPFPGCAFSCTQLRKKRWQETWAQKNCKMEMLISFFMFPSIVVVLYNAFDLLNNLFSTYNKWNPHYHHTYTHVCTFISTSIAHNKYTRYILWSYDGLSLTLLVS